VLLVLGQSNAGNHGTGRGASTRGVVWHAGRCYAIADPLAGATGDGGSVWSRLADDLASPNLVLVVFAVDATRISDWTAGSVGAHLDALIDDVRRHGIAVSAVLWGQGEADARASVTRDDYARELESLVRRLRERGIGAPILVARSTRCRNTGSAAVRDAVALVAANTPGVVAGPDLDALDEATRADGCHFNAAGLQRAALLWRDALRAARVPQAAP
jgi:hypothetical protein